ncbi:hypothetical protein [Roseovarius nanhaiticus]|uniref:hypothetical protein n=1 Tax=Roseovarius nanhaiticus TaxID=573024 RepID=UPI00249179A4|nr:hypothetical protein [Roseovarius nanhaiticus]
MKFASLISLLVLTASSAVAQDCTYPELAPVKSGDTTQYRFTDSCGQAYEVGYRLEGKTLHFPRGGTHTLSQETEADAEKVLRETYGLIGERNSLIRTKD